MTAVAALLRAPKRTLAGRTEPYTEIGVRRSTCARRSCIRKAVFQWQVCSDGNRWRPICAECDIELNALVLRWMGDAEQAEKMRAYRAKVLATS